jgi:putative Mg2+ transporter-C (MgtC) family protein
MMPVTFQLERVTDLGLDIEIVIRIVLAFLMGALIGLERERHGSSAGIRTYGAICLGSCVFGIVSMLVPGADHSRISAQVVSGIGFLGGGIIFRSGQNSVMGLTTAATLWATAAVGLAVALGLYLISLLTSILIYTLLFLPRLSWWRSLTGKNTVLHAHDGDEENPHF